jgi:hypothetical protein
MHASRTRTTGQRLDPSGFRLDLPLTPPSPHSLPPTSHPYSPDAPWRRTQARRPEQWWLVGAHRPYSRLTTPPRQCPPRRTRQRHPPHNAPFWPRHGHGLPSRHPARHLEPRHTGALLRGLDGQPWPAAGASRSTRGAAYEEKEEEKRGRTPICGYWWH